jgi:hypothetical protein
MRVLPLLCLALVAIGLGCGKYGQPVRRVPGRSDPPGNIAPHDSARPATAPGALQTTHPSADSDAPMTQHDEPQRPDDEAMTQNPPSEVRP